MSQGLRLAGCATALALAEAAGRTGDAWGGAERRAARRKARRAAAALRVARLMGELKGPFAKAGQFASLRVDVLAPEVRDAFRLLQDRVPPLPVADVAAVVEEELGAPPS
ncbi:MAG TPA: hypothetical protein VLC53_10625, partial [Myxococcota bacterium]|nr:hypothetical protein [Myxococcota bacterium]